MDLPALRKKFEEINARMFRAIQNVKASTIMCARAEITEAEREQRKREK